MSLGPLGNLIPTAAIDVVGVYTQDVKQQVFSEARAIKVNVKPDTTTMKHPVETGETVTDHRIILPVELELALIIPGIFFNSAYKEIKQLFEDGTLLLVQTRADIYEDQFITSMPHVESPDMYDAIAINLKLQEFQTVTPEFAIAPKKPTNASTVDKGNQQTSDAKPDKTTILDDIFGKYVKK